MMRCPSGESIKDFGDELIYGWPGTDYGLQAAAQNNLTTTQIRQPNKFATFFDFYHGEKARGAESATSGSISSSKWYEVVRDSRNAEFYRTRIYRHYNKKGINAVYMDGHIEDIVNPDWWENLTSPSSLFWEKR
jgi:prepilin-type processing-associated H-X9-DG protein